MGRGRQQTERINSRQVRSVRQAANGQKRISSPGSTQVITLGKTLGNVSKGKTRLRTEPAPGGWLNSPGKLATGVTTDQCQVRGCWEM